MEDEPSGRSRPTILYCGADTDDLSLLRYLLEAAGFVVRIALPTQDCQRGEEQTRPDRILLDCNRQSSAQDLMDKCDRIRSSNRSIIILASHAIWSRQPTLHQENLEILPGATLELIVTALRAVLTRRPPARLLVFEDVELDPVSFRVFRNKQELRLGPTEFRLLRLLIDDSSRVFTRSELVSAAWGKGIHVGSRTVDVHVARLRQSLNKNAQRKLIRTVRGVGYALT